VALCFVANKELTVPFSDIGRRLRERGETVLWMSPGRRWTEWLVHEGWPRGDILCMADFAHEWKTMSVEEATADLAATEGEAPQTISNVIQMCRYLRRQKPSFSYPYLAAVRRHVEPFLRERSVEFVFGEGTWGFELLTWLICRRLSIPMLNPAVTRVPSGRFYFSDSVTNDLWSFTEAQAGNRAWAIDYLAQWLNRPLQPDYMVQHAKGYTAMRFRWVREFVIAVLRPDLDRDDATLWPIQYRVADRIRRLVNSKTFEWLKPYDRELPSERYVLYTLHHQPEASVDVYGSLNSNQEVLIEALSRLLPASHKLWVREHKGAMGDRSLFWFRRVRRLPNVRVVDPDRSIFGLIRNADLVATISGTPGYEAALLGVPAVGLAPVFFASLLANRPHSRSHPLEWNMCELLASKPPADQRAKPTEKSVAFLAHLHANSFSGFPMELEAPEEKRAGPTYMAQEAEAFLSFAAGMRRKRAAQLPADSRRL
jgi:hypothetical protein